MLGAEAEALRVRYTATVEDMLQQARAMVSEAPMSHAVLTTEVRDVTLISDAIAVVAAAVQ
jgi:hypothetical protein